MNQTLTVNLIWGLVLFLGVIIGGALWLGNKRDRMAAASIDSQARVPATAADELSMSESDPDRDRAIVIEETEDDDDAEPPYIGWFY
ncbi:hypothetical protein [Chamaesiphon minutus]|uniref:Uncharacterized protein n=1 Tax=Chamaesiphon minutus (strain ATCC 27169 / PCC 6605) TaxID=1173020 RepID=K9URJ2_CHAP6|nr:hypothetical protein [Chamaesiphon minutus]AFY96874.1 hypothetical protein Cha6605_6034 [Chamaesiphon minutus PCC 6605]